MKQLNQNVLTAGARRIIKTYNKLGRTLYVCSGKAWVQSIDQAKSGLKLL